MNRESEKNYVRKTFVIDKSIIEKLERIAKEKNRSLNWVVKNILAEFLK